MEKKSMNTSVESVLVDGTWKTIGKIEIFVKESDIEKVCKYEVMSFNSSYDESVSVVTFAIYRFMNGDTKDE